MTLLTISADGTPEIGRPERDRLVKGDPEHRTWNIEDRDGLFAGIWESTPGAWRVSYDEWEYCHIISGHSILTRDGGEARHVRAGDAFVIQPGFKGIWEVVEITRKEYVIKL